MALRPPIANDGAAPRAWTAILHGSTWTVTALARLRGRAMRLGSLAVAPLGMFGSVNGASRL
jgi:hypothetical protein